MFNGFTDDTVQFLIDLKFHNSTSYFHEHHERYVNDVQRPFYELIDDLSHDMTIIDPRMEIRPYKCLSRIHRDTRFSKDKSPYRDHHWILFRREAEPREKSLFFYFEFGPQRLDWGMGVWGENRELFDLFRKDLAANPEGSLALIQSLNLSERGMYLGGRKYKRINPPPDIPASLIPWYSIRDMYIGKAEPDYRKAFNRDIVNDVRADFLSLSPLYHLLRGAMETLSTY